MGLAEIILIAFLVLTLVIKRDWKRVGLHVLVGTMIGDVIGLLLVAIVYRTNRNAILWAVNLTYIGAFAGGVYTWLRPAKAKSNFPARKSRSRRSR